MPRPSSSGDGDGEKEFKTKGKIGRAIPGRLEPGEIPCRLADELV